MKNFTLIQKNNRELFNYHREKLPYLSYKCFDELGFVQNAITLRSDINGDPVKLFYHPGEDISEITTQNAQLMTQLGTDLSHRVSAVQKHTANVHTVRTEDLGSSIESSHITFVDALITDIPGSCLAISVADCIPLCFADPKQRAVGAAHSGRVGTLKRIGANTVSQMVSEYGSSPSDIIASIGPGICQDCYEVGDEIWDEFVKEFGIKLADKLLYRQGLKYHLNLLETNRIILLDSGLKDENIIVSNICNRCNLDKFYSFRGDGKIINQICVCMKLN